MKTLATLATRGDAILIGRCANTRRAREIRQMPAEEARQRPLAADADRRQFIRHHCGKGVDDLRYYDPALKTDNFQSSRG